MQRDDHAPLLVFDLDETILRINSFPAWVLFLIAGPVPGLGVRRRVLLSLRSQVWLLRRKLHAISHDELLHALQRAWQRTAGSQGAALMQRFELALLRQVRPNLAAALTWVRTERIDAILATAAAADYADGLGKRLGFDHVVATAINRAPGAPGNSGVHKRDRVLALMAAKAWRDRPLILFTDHAEDLPLMRESRVVYWFGAQASMPLMAGAAPNARLVPCRELTGEALCAMLRADCTNSPEETVVSYT